MQQDQGEDSRPSAGDSIVLHASAVEVNGNALLILGGSGSGKSALALDLIGLGARLVADDRTIVRREPDHLLASAPETIAGRIEARYVGLLRLPYTPAARISLAIDLRQIESRRLPTDHELVLLGQRIALLHTPPTGHAASAIFQCLLQRRTDP